MPIIAEPIREVSLDKIDSVHDWIRETQKHLTRVPVEGVLSNGAVFHDDEYLGDGEVMLKFNTRGIRSFCQRLGFRFDQLAKLETPTLASQVLNDLIQQKEILSKLSEDDFVLDERTGTVIGIVSGTYVSYSNEQFLADIYRLLGELPKTDLFVFREAYGINTELTLRFGSEKRYGTLNGRNGAVEDRTQFGLNFENSMVGTSSVRINYFLYRLICSNGMMVPASSSVNRVFHSGSRESFTARLGRVFKEALRKLDWLGSIFERLGSLPFVPEKLAHNDRTSRQIFEIIPASKQTICDRERLQLRYPSNVSETDRRSLRLEHDTRVIALIPKHFGGEYAGRVFQSSFRDNATMFDFVNVFTEYAKDCRPAQKLEIEEKAGALAKYIAENARKF